MLLQKTAKTFEEFEKEIEKKGYSPKEMRTYHENHISKTMGITMVSFVFIDSTENGRDGAKLHFTRAESACVAQKANKSKDGKIKRKAGDIYYRDCTVTRSNEGTPKEQKFLLLRWF